MVVLAVLVGTVDVAAVLAAREPADRGRLRPCGRQAREASPGAPAPAAQESLRLCPREALWAPCRGWGCVQGPSWCAGVTWGGGPRRPGQVTEPVGKPRAVELQTQRIALGAHLLWG